MEKSPQKFAQLPDKTPFLQKEEGGKNREEANSIPMQKSTQNFAQLPDKTLFLHPEERNSIQIPKSSQKFEHLSDKTSFLAQEEGGKNREEANSMPTQKFTQKFAQFSDKTPFLLQEEIGKNREEANSIPMQKSTQNFAQLPDKTLFLHPEERNSIQIPKSSQKFEHLSDKTPFLQKEQERKRKPKEIPQTPEKMSDTTLPSPTPTTPQKLGINIAGFVKGELGIGEGVRATLRAIETTNIPFLINNIISTPHRNSDTTYQKFTQENPHPINLFQVNANGVKTFLKKPTVKQYFANKYNIGFWAWELPKFPPEWIAAFTPFNDIWTYSNYCAESISMVSPIPVIKMMPSINLPIPKIGREELDLPTDKFIFLFIFDFFSRLQRTNPLATITVFKKAFANSKPNVLLLIKSSNSQCFPRDKSCLINSIGDSPNIKHIDGY